MRNPLKTLVAKFGLPRIIIVSFFLFLVAAAGGFHMNLMQLLSDCIRRWGMFGILALAMVPAVQCGIGLNFGISMGIVGGLLGGLIVIQLQIAQKPSLICHVGGDPGGNSDRRGPGHSDRLFVWAAAEPGEGFGDDRDHLCRLFDHCIHEYVVDAAALHRRGIDLAKCRERPPEYDFPGFFLQ